MSRASKLERRFAHDDRGKRLAWVRPSNPAVAMHLTHVALAAKDEQLFNEIPSKIEDLGGHYTFVGWASADHGRVLTNDGKDAGTPQRGDSLLSEDAFSKLEPS